METTMVGPLLTDERFFGELLNCTFPGLEEIPAAAAAGDYAACRKIFADFFRGYLQPETYFASRPDKGEVEGTDELFKRAEDACNHYMVSCSTPFQFGEKVDWFSNPTYNGYKEWTWQLSRHDELQTLSRAYRAEKNEKYAAACAELFDSWVKQAVRPERSDGHTTLCWRTIECGIRMGLSWPEIIHSFIHSSAFTDDILTDWCKSVWEHGERMYFDHTTGNWLIHELNGLVHIGVLYPFFKDAAEWQAFALRAMKEELELQVYADGCQYELTTRYQQVVIRHYVAVMRILKAYGREIPAEFYDAVEKMLSFYVEISRPDGCGPDINDGLQTPIANVIGTYGELFSENEVFRWAVTERAEGTPPAEGSVVFPYGGLAALRTGWGEEDTYLYFDGGPFGRGHQHEDKLEVLFSIGKKNILAEANCYAYDTSETRAYCLSTRGHNTVRVDGMDQNRRKTYRWEDADIKKHSGMEYNLTDAVDALRAVYNEGYGEEQDKSIAHERSVYFFKKTEGVKPFAVIVDRLTADKDHDYEVMWHLDTDKLCADGMELAADELRLLVTEAPMETAGLSISRGVQFPQWQGWYCTDVQKVYHPVYAAQYWLHAKDIRWVTVLAQDDAITGVEASLDVNDTNITLKKADGTALTVDETEFWK